MSENDVESTNKDEKQHLNNLEERIGALEAENERLKERLDGRQEDSISMSHRQAIAGLIGGGALLGTTRHASAVGENDNDPFADEGHDHAGDVLGESGLVDALYLEELYNAVGEAAPQTAWDGLVVPVAPGIGPSDAIDPDETNTPVQDAIDTLPINGGTVLLPPERVVNRGSIKMRSGVTIQGWGIGYAPSARGKVYTSSEIKIPDEDVDLMRFTIDEQAGIRECALDGFKLTGPVEFNYQFKDRNPSDTTGVGIRFGDETKSESERKTTTRLNVGHISISGVQNAAMRAEPGSGFTECWFENVTTEGLDAGNANAVFDFADYFGVGVHFGVIGAYPLPHATGANSDIFKVGRAGEGSIRHLNVGGATGRAFSVTAVVGEFTVDQLNYETRIQPEPSDCIVYLSGNGNVTVSSIQYRHGDIDHIYRLNNDNWLDMNGNNVIGPINWYEWKGTPWSASKPIAVKSDTTHSTIYMGPSNHVGNNAGMKLSVPVSCLADQTLVSGEEQLSEPYAVSKQRLTIDRDLSELSAESSLSLADDFRKHYGSYTNGGDVWLRWDSNNLYLAADLRDDEHIRIHDGPKTWHDDCIQLGVTSGDPGSSDRWDQLDIVLTPDGPQVHRRVLPDKSVSTLISSATAEIARTDDGHTTYEVALPWSELTASPSEDVWDSQSQSTIVTTTMKPTRLGMNGVAVSSAAKTTLTSVGRHSLINSQVATQRSLH